MIVAPRYWSINYDTHLTKVRISMVMVEGQYSQLSLSCTALLLITAGILVVSEQSGERFIFFEPQWPMK